MLVGGVEAGIVICMLVEVQAAESVVIQAMVATMIRALRALTLIRFFILGALPHVFSNLSDSYSFSVDLIVSSPSRKKTMRSQMLVQ